MTADAETDAPRPRVLPPVRSALDVLRPIRLPRGSRTRHALEERRRQLPLARLVLLFGALFAPVFVAGDALVAGWAAAADQLPVRFALTAAFLAIWAATHLPAMERRWPLLWVAAPMICNLGYGWIIARLPDGTEEGVAGFLFALAAHGIVAPTFPLAVAGFALASAAGLAGLALGGADPAVLEYAAYSGATFTAFFALVAWSIEQGRRRAAILAEEAREAHARADALVAAMLPPAVASRLAAGEPAPAEDAPRATVLFLDMVGFSRLSNDLPPSAVVGVLEAAFVELDAAVERAGLAKIKTMGDAYMAAGGLPGVSVAGPEEAAALARAAVAGAPAFGARHGLPLAVHAGLATGPVTAAVIGRLRPQYDLWGGTVNRAARLQAAAPPGEVWIDAETAAALPPGAAEPVGQLEFRGLGAVDVHRLARHSGA
ncbi:MAG: adenylate/guanylate cyclase domain-containing protein [Paracoccaceae bacterium]